MFDLSAKTLKDILKSDTFIKASRDKRIYLFDKKQKIGEI